MSRLQQCAAEWCFLKPGMDPLGAFRRLKDMGYAGVELVAPERWPAAAAAGLPIVTAAAEGMGDGFNVRANHERLSRSLRESIAAAAGRGVPIVIVFSGNRVPGLSDEEGLAACTEAFHRIAPEAERAGVTIAFEMLNSFDHVGYMGDRASFGFRLARAVRSPRFKILYDVYHMHRMGEDVVSDLRENIDLVCHVHVAGSPRRDFPGLRQKIDYAAVVHALLDLRYSGFVGQEFLLGDDPFPELEAARMLLDRYASDHTELRGRA